MFQRTIASGRFTLAVVNTFAVFIWLVHALFLLSGTGFLDTFAPGTGSGAFFTSPMMRLAGGLVVCAVSAYLMAELNNAYALLRVSSRTLSSIYFLLLTAVTSYHSLSAPHVLIFLAVVTYFPFLASYQKPSLTVYTYLSFLFVSIASVFIPLLLYFVPVLWISQVMLRSLSPRNWMASLLGILTPYWFLAAAAFCTDRLPLFAAHFTCLNTPAVPDYSALTVREIVPAALTLLIFVIGTIDFLHNKHLDKTRTRCNYYVAILHGSAAFVWLLLQPQHALSILPLCMANAAMLGGHFAALSIGKVQNHITIALTVLLTAGCIASLVWL